MTKQELGALKPIEREIEYTDGFYRFLKSIANIMTWALIGIAKVVHYYGLAVILLTVLLKILMHHFTHRQYVSMMKMQKIQPEMKALQERYKDDRQALTTKQFELWKKHGINPLGGCMPMLLMLLIQTPLFLALYQSFYHSAAMRGQPFLWIRDLTLPDQLWYLGGALGISLTINPLPIIYLCVAVWMALNQKPPPSSDPNQEQMAKSMRWIPVLFAAIFYNMPAGLVLYFTLQSSLSAIEIKLIKRRLGMP